MPNQAASSSSSSSQAASSSESSVQLSLKELKTKIRNSVVTEYLTHYRCPDFNSLIANQKKNDNEENVADILLLSNVLNTVKKPEEKELLIGACVYSLLRIHSSYKGSVFQPTRSTLYNLLTELFDVPTAKGDRQDRHKKFDELYPSMAAFNDQVKDGDSALHKALTPINGQAQQMFKSNSLFVNDKNKATIVLENLATLMKEYGPKATNKTEEENEESPSMSNS